MAAQVMTSSIASSKTRLRSIIKEALSNVTTESVAAQSRICFESLVSLAGYLEAKRLSVYLSMPTKEVQTEAIVEDSFARGKTTFIPYTRRQVATMEMLSLQSREDFHSLPRNSWGIPTPPQASLPSRENCLEGGSAPDKKGLDLIVVPCVAFDTKCRRLGHGKGYYDTFFARYRETLDGKMPLLVGLALKEQVLPEGENVPVDSTDWNVDILVVGDGRIIHKDSSPSA